MRIVFPSSATLLIFIVSPLVEGPMMANTLSSSINCLANEKAFSGLAPESLTINWTGLPRMPPFLFVSSTSISRVLASGPPRIDVGPVTDRIAPILIGSAAWANAPVRKIAIRTANIIHFFPFISLSFRSLGSSLRPFHSTTKKHQGCRTMTKKQAITTYYRQSRQAVPRGRTTLTGGTDTIRKTAPQCLFPVNQLSIHRFTKFCCPSPLPERLLS